MRISKGQSHIISVEDWFRNAPPKKGIVQWKDGRSAKELAKAWCGRKDHPTPPEEFLHLLSPLVSADQLEDAEAWPEHIVPIDDLPGEQPNIDLAIKCNGKQGHTVICVEAKADESFGQYVSEMRKAAAKKIEQGVPTGVIERIERLERFLFPESALGLAVEAELRYQLLTGTAATLALAKLHQAPIGVFVLHEFLLDGNADAKKVAQNALDLSRFVRLLTSGAITSMSEGVLQGPQTSPPRRLPWGGVSLYLGMVRTTGALASA